MTEYSNAYEPWSAEDDEILKTSSAAGTSVDSLAKTLQRRPSAIRSRLRKLGILLLDNDQANHQDPAPPTTSGLVARSIAPLKDADPVIYSLLITKIQTGFFEKLQLKKTVNALADQIIEAISQSGDEDAY